MIAAAGSGCTGSYVLSDCYNYGENRVERIDLAAKVIGLGST